MSETLSEEVLKKIEYDPLRGLFRSRKTGKRIGTTVSTDGKVSHVVSIRGNKVQSARIAMFFLLGRWLTRREQVRFMDGDVLNLRASNLELVPSHQPRRRGRAKVKVQPPLGANGEQVSWSKLTSSTRKQAAALRYYRSIRKTGR